MVRQKIQLKKDEQYEPRDYARIRRMQLDLARKGLVLESAKYASEAAKLRDRLNTYR